MSITIFARLREAVKIRKLSFYIIKDSPLFLFFIYHDTILRSEFGHYWISFEVSMQAFSKLCIWKFQKYIYNAIIKKKHWTDFILQNDK